MSDPSAEFRDRLIRAVETASNGTVEDRVALLNEVAHGVTHLSELDRETQALIEKVGALLMEQVVKGLEAIPASPEQRTLQRTLDLASGQHYRPQNILESLEGPPASTPDFASQAQAVCLEGLQDVVDLAHDINEKTTSGNDGIAFQGLMSECVQEAVFGLHAARHGFHGQALAHCRAIYEDVDLLALFRKDSSARDLWLSGDSRAILKELKPVVVRRKLGRTGVDVPYKFLSELGTHTSVHGVLMRSRPIAGDGPERPRVVMHVGGTFDRDTLLPACMALVFQVNHMLLETIGWSQHFHAGFDENWDRLRRMTAAKASFMSAHVLPWMRERGFPDGALETLSQIGEDHEDEPSAGPPEGHDAT